VHCATQLKDAECLSMGIQTLVTDLNGLLPLPLAGCVPPAPFASMMLAGLALELLLVLVGSSGVLLKKLCYKTERTVKVLLEFTSVDKTQFHRTQHTAHAFCVPCTWFSVHIKCDCGKAIHLVGIMRKPQSVLTWRAKYGVILILGS